MEIKIISSYLVPVIFVGCLCLEGTVWLLSPLNEDFSIKFQIVFQQQVSQCSGFTTACLQQAEGLNNPINSLIVIYKDDCAVLTFLCPFDQ